jgi:hypothetical protein
VAVISEVGTPAIRKPSFTRLPSTSTAREAVDPEPRPTTIPSVTSAAADSAAAAFSESWVFGIFVFDASDLAWDATCVLSARFHNSRTILKVTSSESG